MEYENNSSIQCKVIIESNVLTFYNGAKAGNLILMQEICKRMVLVEGEYSIKLQLSNDQEEETITGFEIISITKANTKLWWHDNCLKNYPGEIGDWVGMDTIECRDPLKYLMRKVKPMNGIYDLSVSLELINN